jgi:RimJ/RimL family protein N-acetyltransferase
MDGHHQLGLTPWDIEAAIQRGDKCLAVKEGERVRYSMWVSSNQAFLSSLMPPSLVTSPICYVYGVFTEPESRRQGMYSRALSTVAEQVRPHYKYIMLRTNPENLASIRVTMKAGFVEVKP